MTKPTLPDEIDWAVDFINEIESFKHTHDDFYKQFYCEWKVDQRTIDLEKRLYEYYNTNTTLADWKLFKEWCFINGYSQEDINYAKKVVRTWRLEDE